MKARVEELREEIELKINRGDFKILKTTPDPENLHGYLGEIQISVDGLDFTFSIPKFEVFLCQHKGDISLTSKISKQLYKSYNRNLKNK